MEMDVRVILRNVITYSNKMHGGTSQTTVNLTFKAVEASNPRKEYDKLVYNRVYRLQT
jgi:hypothetical protein